MTFREDDYRIASGVPEFWAPGEYGPLACGCYLVALAFDPSGPCLCLLMQRRDAAAHPHALAEFR
jgi:hypothetical protein